MKMIKVISISGILVSFGLAVTGCGSYQVEIDKAVATLKTMEAQEHHLTSDELEALELQMTELNAHVAAHREDYTEEQLREIGRIQGRYTAFKMRKAFREATEDFKNQVEGFVDGLRK